MGNIFNKDFRDFILSLNKCRVEYILLGGYSVILHGYSRTTGDMDIWVNKTKRNYKKLVEAFNDFGLSVFDMTENNFLRRPELNVFSFGRPPVLIEILTEASGLKFQASYKKARLMQVEGIKIRVIAIEDLKRNKSATGRPKDIDDIQNLGLM